LDILATTRNEAASAVLLAGLDSTHKAVQEGSLRALLARRSLPGQRELVRRWPGLSERWKSIIAEHPGRISTALRDALLGADEALCASACDAVLYLREYDQMPALINAAEDEANPHREQNARTLVELAELLYDELAAPRDYSRRRDPQLVRQYVLTSLENSVRTFDRHKRPEILESFLILVGRDNATLKQILQNPHDKGFLPLVEMLKLSGRTGVVRLLLNFLDDKHAPSAAIGALAQRGDAPLLDHLLKKIGYEPSAAARANLKRIDMLAWLRDDMSAIDGLNDAQQHAAVRLVLATSMKRLKAFEVVRHVLRHGKPAGRRAAAEALAEFKGFEANSLLQTALDDPEPSVQAAALAQLRDRGIPGALTRLIAAVDSPHEAVRAAAQHGLQEFNFHRYLAAFDMLDDDIRRSSGRLVKKVDPQALDQLRDELGAKARMRRLRALELLPYIEAVQDVEALVIELLSDSDHFVRAEAAKALAESSSSDARLALRQALLDPSVMVRETAEQSLQRIAAALAAPQPAPRSKTDTQPIVPPLVPPVPSLHQEPQL
jgi:HEAT repeat protein